MQGEPRRLNPDRFAEAARAKFKNDRRLALALGVHPSQIKRWRDGTNSPGGDQLARLCHVLAVSPSYLFGEPIPEPTPVADALALLRGAGLEIEAQIIESIGAIPAQDRARLRDRIDGWIDAMNARPTAQPPLAPVEEDDSDALSTPWGTVYVNPENREAMVAFLKATAPSSVPAEKPPQPPIRRGKKPGRT